MFRIANRRPNVLVDLEAGVLLMTVEEDGDEPRRRYHDPSLERRLSNSYPSPGRSST